MKNETSSVTRRTPHFTVAPSPFNPVKLELAALLLGGGLLLLAQEHFIASPVIRLLLPLAYGLAGMGWLILRIRRIAAQFTQQEQRDGTQ